MLDLGMGPWDFVIAAASTVLVILALITAVRGEERQRRRCSRAAEEVSRLTLAEIGRRLRAGRPAPDPEFSQVMEEALLKYRPGDSAEETQRQELLREVRLMLALAE